MALVPAGVFTPSFHPVALCSSLVGLTLFSALLVLVHGVTLGNFLLQDVVEAESPCGFIKQQLDKFMEEKSLKVIHTGTRTHSQLSKSLSQNLEAGEASGLHRCTLPLSLSSFLGIHF